jgi:hypothetical protein
MSESRQGGPISPRQAVIAVAATLGLYLLVSFASKSMDAYRLRLRRDEMALQVATLEQQRTDLQVELARRQTTPWMEEALRDSGLLPTEAVGVVLVTATPGPVAPTPSAQPVAASAEPAVGGKLFSNLNWQAWQRLIWGPRY